MSAVNNIDQLKNWAMLGYYADKSRRILHQIIGIQEVVEKLREAGLAAASPEDRDGLAQCITDLTNALPALADQGLHAFAAEKALREEALTRLNMNK